MNLLSRILSREPSQDARGLSFDDLGFLFGGHQYLTPSTTWQSGPEEGPVSSYEDYCGRILSHNPVVFAAVAARIGVFSQARLTWRARSKGAVVASYTDSRLDLFQRPWPGGTTADLLARMLLHADAAGNAFVRRGNSRLHLLRPDWTSIVLGSQLEPDDPHLAEDADVLGYLYRPGGTGPGRFYDTGEVAHFAPTPDPQAIYRGMSWLTPVVREVQGDSQATEHKLKFFENGATPNMVLTFDSSQTSEQVKAFKELFESKHSGLANAYKTLFLGGGADATVVGVDMQQLDFARTQGKSETRILMAAGVPPVVVGASEGLSGSSLNAGNYTAAKRAFADIRLQHLWANAVASLETLVPSNNGGEELWFSTREIPFLQDDLKDTADIQSKQASAIRQLTDGGYEPESVVNAIANDDLSLLEHTGLLPVQVQEPGSSDDKERSRSVERDDMGRIVRIVG